MPEFSPQDLASWTAGSWTQHPADCVSRFCIDSRVLKSGDIFVAVVSDRRDGHDFVSAAAVAGAAGAVVSRPLPEVDLPQLVVPDTVEALQAIASAHRDRFRGRLFGVTGSCGKTSTKDLLAVLLGEADEVLSTEGNLNNHLGVPLTLLRVEPDRHRFAVIEAGISGPGEMDLLAKVMRPDAAIITMIGPAHLDRLGDLDGVAREKAKLADSLSDGGLCYFPFDCLMYEAFQRLSPRGKWAVPHGAAAADDGRGYVFRVSSTTENTHLSISIADGENVAVTCRPLSKGMASNAVLAILAALDAGVSPRQISERMPHWRSGTLRGQWLKTEHALIYLDCYNANPSSMRDAWDSFTHVTPEAAPRLFVVGSMEELGAETEKLHETLGRSLPLRREDKVIAVGRQAEALRQGFLMGGAASEQLSVVGGADEARGVVSDFSGSIFVKGSRRYALENVLEFSKSAAIDDLEAAC